MRNQTFKFSAPIEKLDEKGSYTAVFLPEVLISKLPKGRLRVKGFINSTPFSLAIQYRKNGFRFFLISGALRREAKVKLAETVNVRFILVDNDMVEIPEELSIVLEQDIEANELWNSFSSAWKRGFSHYVNSVKNTDSRIKRAIQIMEKAKRGKLYAQIEKKKKENTE